MKGLIKMEKKEFRAESKRLLDLMINSIYTNKEIFLRELISNASDAIDKLYFISLTDSNVGMSRGDFVINVGVDKDSRTLTVSDNGIGMTADELENNLGIIANSGSLQFKSDNETKEDVDIIGQFGVGFYSAFMVASEVTVETRAYGSDKAYIWRSEGADGYTVEECRKNEVGTVITLKIKEDTEEEKYSDFLENYRIQSIIRKYSDYIRFPIKMECIRSRLKEGSEDEYEEYTEISTINSMVPIWRKNKSELTDEDYNSFYREKFFDYTPPLAHLHIKAEGTATYNALLYISEKAPYDYYSKTFEKGLQLYSSGVMIMDKCADLLPDYFSFVRGLVDSEDLSLNISREMLQQDRQVKIIAKSIEKFIRNALVKMLADEREKYEKFFKAFGMQLKYGVYAEFGTNKDTLSELLLFVSSYEKKPVTLDEYISRMKDDQKYIYYATGESAERLEAMPQTELVRDKGFEILYLTEDVDEFALKMMRDYKEKEFKSVSSGDLDLGETAEEKEEIKAKAEESKELFTCMKEALGDKVSAVRISERLKSHPVCLTSEGEVSIEMEKVLNSLPSDQKVKAQRVLEINPEHEIFSKLTALYGTDPEKVKDYAKLLYNQALLIEGLSVEDPVEFSKLICSLM